MEATAPRRAAEQGFYAISLGFLAWSVLVNKNSLIWHSHTTVTAVLIHLMPAVTCLTVRWQKVLGYDLEEIWPGVFPTLAEIEAATFWDLIRSAYVVYGFWWAVYFIWLLSIGIGAPERGLPTIYNIYRKQNSAIFDRTGIASPRGQVVAFMFIHAALVSLSFLWAALCWWVYPVHVAWVMLLYAYTMREASKYYAKEVIDKCIATPPPRPCG